MEELMDAGRSFLGSFFGKSNYIRWTVMRGELGFDSEATFVQWLLDNADEMMVRSSAFIDLKELKPPNQSAECQERVNLAISNSADANIPQSDENVCTPTVSMSPASVSHDKVIQKEQTQQQKRSSKRKRLRPVHLQTSIPQKELTTPDMCSPTATEDHLPHEKDSENSEYSCLLCFSTFGSQSLLENHLGKVHFNDNICNNIGLPNDDISNNISNDYISNNISNDDICNNIPNDDISKNTPNDDIPNNIARKELSELVIPLSDIKEEADRTEDFSNATLNSPSPQPHMQKVSEIAATGPSSSACSSSAEPFKEVATPDDPTKPTFVCKFCDDSYRSKQSVIEHYYNTHTNERNPFKCYQCGKTFSSKSYVSKHKRSHTGETPYECHLCQKRFSFRSTLNNHLRTHSHGVEMLKAQISLQQQHLLQSSPVINKDLAVDFSQKDVWPSSTGMSESSYICLDSNFSVNNMFRPT